LYSRGRCTAKGGHKDVVKAVSFLLETMDTGQWTVLYKAIRMLLGAGSVLVEAVRVLVNVR
jgi:hypothetical protein